MDESGLILIKLFDGAMVAIMLWLAWRTLADRDLFRATITFIALGLLIALTWVRLRAPDVALAEAAISSGLTGALILSALARMRRREIAQRAAAPKENC
ncbi:MAG: Na(+)/H(+) antiporter subunit B [Alphaproteobacteria bacterium]